MEKTSNDETKKVLNEQTKIVLNFKHIITFTTSMLTFIYLFYQFVIVPKFDTHEKQITKIEKSINEGFEKMNNNFNEIYNGIGVINGNIEGINQRFGDLNRIRSDEGGGFN